MTGDRWTETSTALRALASPITVASLVLLALNDHVLKQAWPGWVTGKLSDGAGLVVAPALLAVALAVLGTRRPQVLAVVLTGAGFAVVKTTQIGSEVASDLWSTVLWTSYIRRDPTDLIALPALLVTLRVHRLVRSTPVPTRRRQATAAAGAVLLPFALLATAATSPACRPFAGVRSIGVMKGRWEVGRLRWDQGRRFVFEGTIVMRPTASGLRVRPMSDLELRRSVQGRSDQPAGGYEKTACDPEGLDLCWRVPQVDPPTGGQTPKAATAQTVTLQASRDGGLTWADEQALGPDQARRLRRQATDNCGGPLLLEADAVAVMATGEGPVVVVTMPGAGVLYRDADGRWSVVSEADIDAAVKSAAATQDVAVPYRRYLEERPILPVPALPPVTARVQPDGSPPASPATPTPWCPSPTLVTVTPDPRNGPASTVLRCDIASGP